jgi:hypothetical protein
MNPSQGSANPLSPSVIINFAGNLAEEGGPLCRPPTEDYALSGIWSDGYYTNDSRQTENWMFINVTATNANTVWLNWMNKTGDTITWTNWTYAFINRGGSVWEYNTSGHIPVYRGCNYSFDVVAIGPGGTTTVSWSKVKPGSGYTRRFVQLKSGGSDTINYTPFYMYRASNASGFTADDCNKPDRLHHDQGPDGGGWDTGYLLTALPSDNISATYCGGYIGHFFDQSVSITPTVIQNYYLHFWYSVDAYPGTTPAIDQVGWMKTRDHLGAVLPNDCFTAYPSQAKSTIPLGLIYGPSMNGTYHLESRFVNITGTSFTENSIYEFCLFFQATSDDPVVFNNRSLISYVIFNIPDNETLNATDWTSSGGKLGDYDGDGLSDWTELYVTFTSPFLRDTDHDRVNDYNEALYDTDPNDYTFHYRVNTPITPSGPTSLLTGQQGIYNTSASDPDVGDSVQYRFDWDATGMHAYSNWTSLMIPGQSISLSHAWTAPGIYTVKAQARDSHGAYSLWSEGIIVTVRNNNQPPDVPSINGPTQGKTGHMYSYTIQTTDPEGDNISYYVDWGDGTNTGWTGPYPSGRERILNHSWTTKATFTVKAKALDTNGAESSWGTLQITIPTDSILQSSWFLNLLDRLSERHPHVFAFLQRFLQIQGYYS